MGLPQHDLVHGEEWFVHREPNSADSLLLVKFCRGIKNFPYAVKSKEGPTINVINI